MVEPGTLTISAECIMAERHISTACLNAFFCYVITSFYITNCFPYIGFLFRDAPIFVVLSRRKPAFIETILDTCGAAGRP
jgi:hypothetical protein